MNHAILLEITVDNLPTLYACTRQMGERWFLVLSDFWPHGEAALRYGILRTDGTAEQALFIIDKAGIIGFIQVSDINRRPNLKDIADARIALQYSVNGNTVPLSLSFETTVFQIKHEALNNRRPH